MWHLEVTHDIYLPNGIILIVSVIHGSGGGGWGADLLFYLTHRTDIIESVFDINYTYLFDFHD